jgi:NAD(P)-dependent dehydrogenase (short-subunit alcohol dehydrogenase family)
MTIQPMFNLAGKVALVAGGAGFLGKPASRALAAQGAAVLIASRNAERVSAAVDEIRGEGAKDVAGIALDVADEQSVDRAVEQTIERFGRLDILVNATYTAVGKPMDELTGAEFDRANHGHITGSFLLCRAAARAMKKQGVGGSIVQYVSMYGLVSPDPGMYIAPMNPNPIEYGVAKAGLCQMVRYMAAMYGPDGIRVNAIAPGAFDDQHDRSIPGFVERMGARAMLGRPGKCHETAGAVVFLASDEASYVTGSVLRVDGGWTAW